MPTTTLAEAVVSGGGIRVTARVTTDAEPSLGLAVFSSVLDRAMLAVAERVLVPELQRTLSVYGPPVSPDGTPPHREPPPDQSSQAKPSYLPPLAESIGAWPGPDGGVAVGTVNLYGMYLEIGTQDMAPRPWLVPTLTRTDVVQRFGAELSAELARMLAAVAGDSPPQSPPAQGAPVG